MIGLVVLLLQSAPRAPAPPVPYPPASGIRLDCTLRAPESGEVLRFSANILAEDKATDPKSGERSRTIVISGGPLGLAGKYQYGWQPWLGTHHTVQIDDYDRNTDYLLTLEVPKSDRPAAAMLYRWRRADTTSVGYCTHNQDPS